MRVEGQSLSPKEKGIYIYAGDGSKMGSAGSRLGIGEFAPRNFNCRKKSSSRANGLREENTGAGRDCKNPVSMETSLLTFQRKNINIWLLP